MINLLFSGLTVCAVMAIIVKNVSAKMISREEAAEIIIGNKLSFYVMEQDERN